MAKTIIWGILLLLLSFSTSAEELRFKWKKLKTPVDHGLIIISANSTDDLWLYDQKGELYHFFKNKWIKYPPPKVNNFNFSKIASIGDDRFIFWGFDPDYKSLIYFFENGKYSAKPLKYDLPLYELLYIDDNNIYFYGNFGSFLRLNKNSFEKVSTPIKNHIWCIDYLNKNELWLGSNFDGIYRYKNGAFKFFPFKDKKFYSINLIKVLSKDKIYAKSVEGKTFKLNGDYFEESKLAASDMFEYQAYNRVGFNNYTYVRKGGGELNFKIPSDFKIASLKLIDKKNIIFTTNDGGIVFSQYYTGNYFINLARAYGVDGYPDDYTYSAAFADLNLDSYPDLIVHSAYARPDPTVYINSPNLPFTRLPGNSNLSANSGSFTNFIVADYTNDYYPDILASFFDTTGTSLVLYKSSKAQQFTKFNSFRIPYSVKNTPTRNLSASDIDADGDIDIDVTYYYGTQNLPGEDYVLYNSLCGEKLKIDSSASKYLRAWNQQSIFADFNGDGKNDWFSVNCWRKSKLLIAGKNGYSDESEIRLKESKENNFKVASAFDYDNDGDLDLLLNNEIGLLNIYQNDGRGYFSDVTGLLLKNISELNNFYYGSSRTIYTGDFNNDGYQDIFLSVTHQILKRNFLLINCGGKYFEDRSDQYEIKTPSLLNAAIADIDNDGDLDIFGAKEGSNILWINTLDDSNYLNICLRGVISNTQGLGAKIFVYKSGMLNNTAGLVGYRQVGSSEYGLNNQHDLMQHFGLDGSKRYDIKVEFYGGMTKIRKNVPAGQTIIIREMGGMLASLYLFQGILFRYFSQSYVQYYILFFLIGLILVGTSIRFGYERFHWNIKLTLGLVLVNITIFIIMLILASASPLFIVKYLLPLGILFVGIIIPNVIFYGLQKNNSIIKPAEEVKAELLNVLMSFSHGEWALRNLNSLQLLCENAPREFLHDDKFLNQLHNRADTFATLTSENIRQIIKLTSEIGAGKAASELKNFFESVNEDIYKLAKGSISIKKNNLRYYAEAIKSLRNIINKIKTEVYSDYSCEVLDTIISVVDTFQNEFTENNIEIIRTKSNGDRFVALIKCYELADIMDNMLRNSIRALQGVENKKIEINVLRSVPKIIIEVRNNGYIIAPDKWEKIFEQGYSEFKSTGFGLFKNREVLKKYGARIFVKESSDSLTNFNIELNEGKKHETPTSNN